MKQLSLWIKGLAHPRGLFLKEVWRAALFTRGPNMDPGITYQPQHTTMCPSIYNSSIQEWSTVHFKEDKHKESSQKQRLGHSTTSLSRGNEDINGGGERWAMVINKTRDLLFFLSGQRFPMWWVPPLSPPSMVWCFWKCWLIGAFADEVRGERQ